jgi:hypothetical protein
MPKATTRQPPYGHIDQVALTKPSELVLGRAKRYNYR